METGKVHVLDLQFQGKKLAIYTFLVESNEGPILIETGPHSSFGSLTSEIERVGFKKEDIKHVFLTHIHLDHAGAAWCFAEHGAQIYLHPLGYKHMHDPSRLLDSATRIYGDMMEQLWGTLKPIPADQLTVVEDNVEIEIGGLSFKSLHTPGHAKHHIAWQMDNVVFTGDVAGVRINQGPIIPPCPPPDIDIEAWENSIEKLLAEDKVDTYYLTHGGFVNDLREHMAALKKTLHEYANFMLPYFENEVSQAKILEPFQDFVEKNLKEQGMDPELAVAYSLANPAYMSVAGLMRYWSKKTAKQ